MLMDSLISRIIEMQSPIAVGLNPNLSQIPDKLKSEPFLRRGKTPEAVARIFFRFNRGIIDQIHDVVPAVRVPLAAYIEWGVAGIDCYAKTIAYAKSKKLLVIGDAMAGVYTRGHIGRVDVDGTIHKVFDEDFITVSPYMGYDTVEPYLADCKGYGKGIFVVVKTPNPGAGDVQDLKTSEGLSIYRHVGHLVSHWGRGMIGEYGFSAVGAVVGAVNAEESRILRENMPHTFFMVPEYGKIGSLARDIKELFNKKKAGAIVNAEAGVIDAFQQDAYKGYGEAGFAQAAKAAVMDMKRELAS